jgi:diguanylate cyclase (GGDEF)-like protein/PAS domain S-box-containing protein
MMRLRGSIYGKLIAIGVPAIIVINLLITGGLAFLQYGEHVRSLNEKLAILMGTEAQILAPEVAAHHGEGVVLRLRQFVTNPEIIEAVAYDETGQEIGRATGLAGEDDARSRSEPIVFAAGAGTEGVGRLYVRYSTHVASDRFRSQALAGLAAVVFSSAVLILVTGWILRRFIGVPLAKLMVAFEASGRDGRRHRVNWRSTDEIGRVADAFNRMQASLDVLDADRQAFQDRLERFYNGTPVMLHSINDEGILLQVSNHWCTETGYRREEAVGMPLVTFLTAESAVVYEETILPNYLTSGITEETPLQFVCADRRIMDVLLAETRESYSEGNGAPSLSVMTDISKIKLAERELERLVGTDSLTGLFNRRGFVAELEKALATGIPGTIAFVDLDRFKRINDTYGHPAGDHLLITIARRLMQLTETGGFAGRLGGDEFALFVPDEHNSLDCEALATATLGALRRPVALPSAIIEPSGSVGFAHFPEDGATSSEIIIAADLALYRAKHSGRDRVERFDERLRQELAEKREQEDDIRDGLAHDWFIAYIQPIVRLSDGRIVGGEALARLNHPAKGILPPAHFIHTAEEIGLVDSIGRSILRQAISVIPVLIDATGNPDFYLSINLSGGQVRDDLPTFLKELMAEYGVKSTNIVLEIIETALFDDTEKASEILTALSTMGIRFALDDFGTGFSSLNYVQQFPVSMIKIDRSYTCRLRGSTDADQRIGALVRTCVTLGSELGLPIVAEGIELMEELERIRALGVELGQGYLFSPPLRTPLFIELVTASRGPSLPRAFRITS